MQTTLYLIRHGVTGWNKQKKYCGYMDVPLSREGCAQAKKLGARVKKLEFDAIYASDLKRAYRTARIAFGAACAITRVPGLQEMNFGVLEGLRHDEIVKKYGRVYKKWLANPFKNHLPKGERIGAFQKRVTKAVNRLIAQNRGKTIAAVCHGGTISVFVMAVLRKKSFWKYVPRSTSVTIVEYKGNNPRIALFDCIGHLL
ncbi:MAG: histidine phosphatase family protein [Candidatus Omnitrophica bacterium]|nr:histidine phosphatase family protein [Candidatus Omnitrophota bacterium]